MLQHFPFLIMQDVDESYVFCFIPYLTWFKRKYATQEDLNCLYYFV